MCQLLTVLFKNYLVLQYMTSDFTLAIKGGVKNSYLFMFLSFLRIIG